MSYSTDFRGMLKCISVYCMYSISKTSGVAAQLFPPKMLTGPPNGDL